LDQERWLAALEHRERLLRLAVSRGMSAEDAKDVVQEALVRAAEFERLDPDRLPQFLTAVTIRLCADVHRKNEEPARAKRWLTPFLANEPDPADLICRDHGPEWVESLVGRLPDRQRRVIVDRARGLSIQQIAHRHELTYKAAESALSRARAALRHMVTASLSVTAFFRGRGRPARAAMITASAAALAVTAAVLTTPEPAERPEAAPPERRFTDVTAPKPKPVPSRAPRPVRTPAPPAPAVRGAPVATQPPRRPPDPLPTFSVNHGPVTVERGNDGYTLEERLDHCLRYGLETYPIVQCSYPPSPGERS
jgi:RNA polymerase sigma-70 factor (ECF subfamily)